MRNLIGKAAKAAQAMTYPMGRSALAQGVAAALEHDRILAEPWQTVVDIGANRGQFALAVLRVRPNTVIHSFEPLSGAGQWLEAFFRGRANVHVHRVAIGPERAQASINVSAKDDSSSLLTIGKSQQDVFGTEHVGTERVTVVPLDDRISRSEIEGPALLKLDVQGFELEALRGCESLLGAFDAVYVECSLMELYEGQALFGEVVTWLFARGFDLADIGPVQRHQGRAVQGDFLFRRRPAC